MTGSRIQDVGTTASSLQMRCHAIHSAGPDGGTPWIVGVAGEVDYTNSEEFRARLDELLAFDQPDRVIVDLAGVTRVDSSGLATLLAASRDAGQRHVRFTLSGLSKSLRHALERTRLSSLLEIRLTVHQALQT